MPVLLKWELPIKWLALSHLSFILKIMEKFILIIFGPTGVGKTACADHIALSRSIEIINMDMGQLYTPLNIGTAKPDWRSSITTHHMFDVINDPINFTIAEYRSKIASLIQEIWQRDNLPVLVGGSGFYLRALFFPPQVPTISDDSNSTVSYPPGTDLWHELYIIDPDRAQFINKNDIYRLERALSIWHTTGQKPSSFISRYEPVAPFKLIYLTRDRVDLYNRIDERVLIMLKQGWLDEVKSLLDTSWEPFIMKKKIIGYDNLIDYLRGEQTQQSLQQTIAAIQQRTRNYAKRQMTYWRMLRKEIECIYHKNGMINEASILPFVEVNLTTGDLDLYIKRLLT